VDGRNIKMKFKNLLEGKEKQKQEVSLIDNLVDSQSFSFYEIDDNLVAQIIEDDDQVNNSLDSLLYLD
jgi:hypothetical protein